MMDRMMSMMKPFMKKEVIETIKFHTSLETLYDTLPRDILPNEFGGTLGNIDDFHESFVKVLESKR
jgi:hypothetical protein